MDKPQWMLAKKERFGSIYQCDCGCFHLQIGPINLQFSRESYCDLVDLVNTSAANFELATPVNESNDPVC